jgi:hypothetical protein
MFRWKVAKRGGGKALSIAKQGCSRATISLFETRSGDSLLR